MALQRLRPSLEDGVLKRGNPFIRQGRTVGAVLLFLCRAAAAERKIAADGGRRRSATRPILRACADGNRYSGRSLRSARTRKRCGPKAGRSSGPPTSYDLHVAQVRRWRREGCGIVVAVRRDEAVRSPTANGTHVTCDVQAAERRRQASLGLKPAVCPHERTRDAGLQLRDAETPLGGGRVRSAVLPCGLCLLRGRGRNGRAFGDTSSAFLRAGTPCGGKILFFRRIALSS